MSEIDQQDLFESIRPLVKAGLALQWLHQRSKRPIGNEWASKPVASFEDLRRTYRDGYNVGVRLGKWSNVGGNFLHVVDMDVRNPELESEVIQTLRDILPELDLDACPTVISGSGGASRHYYFTTARPFNSRKFAHSEGSQMVFDEQKRREVRRWKWELHLLGTGSQAVLPPSIHPNTGFPYKWHRRSI